MFDGFFREAPAGTVVLQDDEPAAVFGMLAWFYGLLHNGKDSYLPSRLSFPNHDQDALDYVKYQVDLFVTADKYGVRALCNAIIGDFAQMLAQLVGPNNTLSDSLADVIKHVYVKHDFAALKLREPILALLASNTVECKEDANMKDLLGCSVDLSFDLWHAMNKSIVAERQTDLAEDVEIMPMPRKRARRGRN
jgi:hypothetical protein